ncbi:MAG: hypothetical protein GVY13_13330 [Alphaproteobacteria bacterium]|jgi:hypothetical protein|nr:hypothetical protein [Alphaproteobacteria bacterium]
MSQHIILPYRTTYRKNNSKISPPLDDSAAAFDLLQVVTSTPIDFITKNYLMLAYAFPPSRMLALKRMATIDRIALDYSEQNSLKVKNPSSWAFSEEYRKRVLSHIRWVEQDFSLNYNYSTELGLPELLSEKLQIPGTHTCVITANTSQAIIILCSLAAQLRLDSTITAPFYWSILENSRIFGTDPEYKYFIRSKENSKFFLDESFELRQAIWLTDPPYSTNGEISSKTIKFLDRMCGAGHLLFIDYALQDPSNLSFFKFKNVENIFFILSPHKSINVNGSKFAAIFFPNRFSQFFEEFSDSLIGSLPSSTINAAYHFLTDNFDIVCSKKNDWVYEKGHILKNLIEQYDNINTDFFGSSIYMTVYFHHLPSNFLDDKRALLALVEGTGCIVIPGSRNYANPIEGLSFRLNLSIGNNEFFENITKIFSYLVRCY